MTTQKTVTPAQMTKLSDAPPRDPDEVTAFRHLYDRGLNDYLTFHFGSRETTLITGDCRVLSSMDDNLARARRPDLLIARHVSPQAFWARGAYIISEQGKPPDFVMEIASQSTGDVDTGPKRVDYALLRIPEYWRFDETGIHHHTKLAGDHLVSGHYEPITIDALPDGSLRGYSTVLNLILEWREGQLNWIDPETEEHIPTFATEREGRLQAEARIRELEERLARRQEEGGPDPDAGGKQP